MSDRLPEPRLEPLQPSASERASASPRAARTSHAVAALEPETSERPRGLVELQRWMVDAISGPHVRAVDSIVAPGPRLSARERLEIYRHGYAARLSECLRDDYPVLAATLGEPRFAELCRLYIELHPSASPSLNAFGRHMSRLCASATLQALEGSAFCAELATLEWALVEVTHAEAPGPLDPTELQRIPADAWGDARLIAADCVRLLSFRYPVNAHYQAYRGDGELLPLPSPAASATVVYRRETQLWRMDLTPAMNRVLSALLSGQTIAQALAQIGVREDDPAALAEAERSVMIWFQAWIGAGFFTRVATKNEPHARTPAT